jgi:hypothetical protein
MWATAVEKWTASVPTPRKVEEVIGGAGNGKPSTAEVKASVKA